jgi:hypothetical protein
VQCCKKKVEKLQQKILKREYSWALWLTSVTQAIWDVEIGKIAGSG